MTISFFSKLSTDMIIEIFTHESPEDLYEHCLRVNRECQKAAMTVLLSRRESADDAAYQEKLFQNEINPHLKKDSSFTKRLQIKTLTSMRSHFSTLQHKLHGSIFLDKLKGVPHDFISNEAVIALCSSKDNEIAIPLLTAILPQSQVDNIISEIALILDHDSRRLNRRYVLTLKALASRVTSSNLNTFSTLIMDEKNNFLDVYYGEPRIPHTLPSGLDEKQVNTLIMKMMTGNQFPEKYLIELSIRFTPDQAHTVFKNVLLLMREDAISIQNERHLLLLSIIPKLNAASVEEFIFTNRYTTSILASRATPEQASTLFQRTILDLPNAFDKEAMRKSLAVIVPRLDDTIINEYITNSSLVQCKMSLK